MPSQHPNKKLTVGLAILVGLVCFVGAWWRIKSSQPTVPGDSESSSSSQPDSPSGSNATPKKSKEGTSDSSKKSLAKNMPLAPAAGTSVPSPELAAPTTPPPPPGCYTAVVKTSERRVETFADHKISLEWNPSWDTASVCVRVKGIPVAHKVVVKTDQRLDLSVGGLDRGLKQLEVRYCAKGANCKESCAVPKDEFLEALSGGGAGGGADAREVGWNGQGPSDEEKKLDKELDAFAAAVKADLRSGTLSTWKVSSVEGPQTECKRDLSQGQRQARLN